jgi:pyruvate dehydrogenase E2 component (dihydrolipoamide acetyltransferase)
VQGTGPGGRIVKVDVENFRTITVQPIQPTAPATAQPVSAAPASPVSTTHPTPPSGPGITLVPVSRMRSIIARRMVESATTIPDFQVTVEIDMEALLSLRKQINEGLDEASKVTVNDMLVKAVAVTLRQYPNLNSHFYGDVVATHDYVNIGIAVPVNKGGLMNVVSKNADTTPITVMAKRHKEMIANAREGKVRPEDIEGGTFSTSNLGPYEVVHFTAIINPPEAGIVAFGTSRQVEAVVDGQKVIRNRMYATLSADHRVTDGAEASMFMQALKKNIENPMRMLI